MGTLLQVSRARSLNTPHHQPFFHLYTYDRETEAIIFVIDSSDKLRIPVAKDELDLLLQNAGSASAFMHRESPWTVRIYAAILYM